MIEFLILFCGAIIVSFAGVIVIFKIAIKAGLIKFDGKGI